MCGRSIASSSERIGWSDLREIVHLTCSRAPHRCTVGCSLPCAQVSVFSGGLNIADSLYIVTCGWGLLEKTVLYLATVVEVLLLMILVSPIIGTSSCNAHTLLRRTVVHPRGLLSFVCRDAPLTGLLPDGMSC